MIGQAIIALGTLIAYALMLALIVVAAGLLANLVVDLFLLGWEAL